MRPFAGRADWCSNSTISRSITACGWKKASRHRASSRSKSSPVQPQSYGPQRFFPRPSKLGCSCPYLRRLSAPTGKPMLLELFDQERKVLTVTEDVAAIYNVLYRYLFDRHRDLTLPTSFLIDAQGNIVKVYQGPVNPQDVEEDFKRIPQNSQHSRTAAGPGASLPRQRRNV